MVGVVVVDDQAPFRQAARAVIAATPGFELVGEARTGEEAVRLARSLGPDLVLMDIKMPGISGIEATTRIAAAGTDTAVVLVSTYRETDLPASARTCGAAAFIHKNGFGPSILGDIWHSLSPRAAARTGRAAPP
jgi:two-component system, NarL family, invasion response regulator UvrY